MALILQLGCIHSVAVYSEMMKRVTFNYLKFLFWFFPLIIAFTFSFYILYHKEDHSEVKNGHFSVNSASGNFSIQDDNFDFYRSFNTSLLKTAIMMIGEFDASNMSFDNGSYFVFLIFVFMMTIVLMNLLNGLAVSDIQAIRNDAELVAYKSKMKLVHHFESVVFKGPLKNCCRCQFTGQSPSLWFPGQRRLQKVISLFPDLPTNGRLEVFLGHRPRYTDLRIHKSEPSEEFRPDTCCRIGKYRIGKEVNREVLIAAKDIVNRRQNGSRQTKIEEDLQGCKKKLEDLEKLLKQLINEGRKK
jgi:hypothetical protein